MKTLGIIAEFNPFHNGHKYLIEQARSKTGADCCVVIMSGDFVQRGAPAVCNKYLRAEMALKCGADIVFELPCLYSLGSAEAFATGAVNLLSSTGLIDYLCFGSESGDTDSLIKCADIISDETGTDNFKEKLSEHIKSGESYPSAFSKVLSDSLGNLQPLLYSPNNLLGLEYIRAINKYRLSCESAGNPCHSIKPVAIKRMGSDHFDTEISEYSSATAVRNHLYSNAITKSDPAILSEGLSGALPLVSYDIIKDNYSKFLPITEDDFSSVLYMRLNTMSDEELFSIPAINPDVIHKLTNFRGKKILISDLIMNLKSKCFTYTGISRALFRILLSPFYTAAAQTHLNAIRPYRSVTENDTENNESYKPYLRVLGFKKSCSEFLRNLRYSDDIDIITKPSDGPLDNPSYKLDIFAAGLYEQICSNKFKTGFTEELKTGPVIFD